jgi:cell pole-organizing protein PopZ
MLRKNEATEEKPAEKAQQQEPANVEQASPAGKENKTATKTPVEKKTAEEQPVKQQEKKAETVAVSQNSVKQQQQVQKTVKNTAVTSSAASTTEKDTEKKDTEKTAEKITGEQKPEKAAPPAPSWVVDMTSPQEVMIVFAKGRIDYTKLQKIYSNYTKNNFPKDSLKVEMGDLFEGYKYITVSGFKNIDKAKNYRNIIKGNQFLIRDFQRKEYYIWLITPENKETLKQNKDLKGYDEFFNKEYGN